jgi:hypothetical protein
VSEEVSAKSNFTFRSPSLAGKFFARDGARARGTADGAGEGESEEPLTCSTEGQASRKITSEFVSRNILSLGFSSFL